MFPQNPQLKPLRQYFFHDANLVKFFFFSFSWPRNKKNWDFAGKRPIGWSTRPKFRHSVSAEDLKLVIVEDQKSSPNEEVPIKLKTSSRLKMSYLLFVCSGQPRDVPKRVMRVQSCCFGDKLDLT